MRHAIQNALTIDQCCLYTFSALLYYSFFMVYLFYFIFYKYILSKFNRIVLLLPYFNLQLLNYLSLLCFHNGDCIEFQAKNKLGRIFNLIYQESPTFSAQRPKSLIRQGL